MFVLFVLFWWVFIKEHLADIDVGICVNGNEVLVRNGSAFKIIDEVWGETNGDTMNVNILMTTLANPFKSKSVDTSTYRINLNPNIKYIKLGDRVRLSKEVRKCQ